MAVAMKTCTKCKHPKPHADFNIDASRPDGRQAWCRACQRARARERRYGVGADEYARMLAAQDGKCAICGATERRVGPDGEVTTLCVDHDHKTGAVRALLCHGCNVALGQFDDDPERLEAAAAYVRRWS